MYLPAQTFITSTIGTLIKEGGKDDPDYSLVDAIVKWISETFRQSRESIVKWVSETFSQLQSNVDLDEVYKNAQKWAMDVLHAINEPLQQHPYWSLFLSLFIFLGPWILLIPLFLLQAAFYVLLGILGFGAAGITGGSPAALYQSAYYGGHTPAGSMFAILQSTAVHYNVGTASNWVLLVIRILAGALAAYIFFGIVLVDA